MSNLGGNSQSEETDRSNNLQGADGADGADGTNGTNGADGADGAGTVVSIVGGTNCSVDSSDAANPIVNADTQATATAKGDLEGFSTVAARIPVGTNDQVLTADSAAALGVAWKTPAGGGGGSAAKAILTTDVTSIGTASNAIDWETVVYDDDSFFDIGTVPEQLTVPTGVTRVNICSTVSASAVATTTPLQLQIIRYNSADVFQETVSQGMYSAIASGFVNGVLTALGADCVAGDYFTVRYQTGDASWNIISAIVTIQDAS